MNHIIKVLSVDKLIRNSNGHRRFEVEIDGVILTGTVQFLESAKPIYKFYFGEGNMVSKHPDYKNIRRQLLSALCKATGHMSEFAIR